MKKIYLVNSMFLVNVLFSQITINNTGFTVTQLVNNLLGSGVTASNVSFKGVYNISSRYQIGAFTTAGSVQTNLGFSSGVVLTSGNTSEIPLSPLTTNPGSAAQISRNYVSGTTGEVRSSNSPSGQDSDVQNLTTPFSYYNAAILEFDFIPNNTNISFRYSFGSEEYMDDGGFINYNCSSYNDKFAFLISGPGIAGGQGYSNNAKNIARLSNSAEVSINSVNNGTVGSSGGSPSSSNCQSANTAWIQNTVTSEFKGIIYGVNYNGNTNVLSASQSGLTPGATYHIRIMISDVSDGAYDSGVFLEAGSFSSPISLPITLIDFKGSCDDKGVILNWETASEKDNQRFIIERSLDGVNFERIGEIAGSVSTNNIQHYFFYDNNPINGLNYYRLKQQDFDEEITVFKIISVESNCLKGQDLIFSLYPNPGNQNLFIDFNLDDYFDISFEITNTLGQAVRTIPSKHYDKGFQNLNIDINNLNPGIYYFKISVSQKITVLKFIKI